MFSQIPNFSSQADLSIVNGYVSLCQQCTETVKRVRSNPYMIIKEELPAKFLIIVKKSKESPLV